MLILTRRVGERIMIGDDIVVTVMNVDAANRVRIAVDAPREIPVNREEVHERIKREKAAGLDSGGRCD